MKLDDAYFRYTETKAKVLKRTLPFHASDSESKVQFWDPRFSDQTSLPHLFLRIFMELTITQSIPPEEAHACLMQIDEYQELMEREWSEISEREHEMRRVHDNMLECSTIPSNQAV